MLDSMEEPDGILDAGVLEAGEELEWITDVVVLDGVRVTASGELGERVGVNALEGLSDTDVPDVTKGLEGVLDEGVLEILCDELVEIAAALLLDGE